MGCPRYIGTQPTGPVQTHALVFAAALKDSPLPVYTVPPKTQGAPSLAEGEEGKKRGMQGSSVILEAPTGSASGMELVGLQGEG